MKKLFIITLLFLVQSFPSLSMDCKTGFYDLVKRDGVRYKKFSDVPVTTKITGLCQGNLKNGKIDGLWKHFYDNGQLLLKVNYSKGVKDGMYFSYHENGNLNIKGKYINGLENGLWVTRDKYGKIEQKKNYKNGRSHGSFISYWENGQLRQKGNYKFSLKEGYWIGYDEKGKIIPDLTGNYIKGKKVSN